MQSLRFYFCRRLDNNYNYVDIKVVHGDSKCDFLKILFCLHRLIPWNVFFKMTHILPLISAQNSDNNALQNRRGRPACS